MALISNIVIELASGTAVITVTKNGNNVEVISFDNSNKQVSFDTRSQITISGIEFLDLVNQINIFETVILFNFHPNFNSPIPFNTVNALETHDADSWDFVFSANNNNDVVDYTCKFSDQDIRLNERTDPKIVQFPCWIYFLYSLKHYQLSILHYLSL